MSQLNQKTRPVVLSRYQIKLRKMYAICTNQDVHGIPVHISDKHMENSIASWMGIFRMDAQYAVELSNLHYQIDTLTTQVELSIAGQKGAHKIAIARVKAAQAKLR